MLKDEAPPRRRLPVSLQGALLAVTLIIFLLLHVLAAALLLGAGAANGPASSQDLTLQHFD